jgi:hypothetical protein
MRSIRLEQPSRSPDLVNRAEPLIRKAFASQACGTRPLWPRRRRGRPTPVAQPAPMRGRQPVDSAHKSFPSSVTTTETRSEGAWLAAAHEATGARCQRRCELEVTTILGAIVTIGIVFATAEG